MNPFVTMIFFIFSIFYCNTKQKLNFSHFLPTFVPLQVKEKKTHIHTPKPPFLDFSPIKSSTVRMLMIIASVASIGIYTPIFNLVREYWLDWCNNGLIAIIWLIVVSHSQSLHGFEEGFDMQDLVLLQTFLGLSLAIGIVASGSSINKTFQLSFRTFKISRQYVCQVSDAHRVFSRKAHSHIVSVCFNRAVLH
jgi:hypothetical protein